MIRTLRNSKRTNKFVRVTPSLHDKLWKVAAYDKRELIQEMDFLCDRRLEEIGIKLAPEASV